MSNVIEAAFIFFIIMVAGFIALTSLSQTSTLATGNCAYNSSGSLVNCSLSDAQYKLVNNSQVQIATTFTAITQINWITGAAVLFAALLTFTALIKK